MAERDLAGAVELFVSLPAIFMVLLRHEGWPIAAYPHKADPTAWSFKVTRVAVMTLNGDGRVTWKGVSSADKAHLRDLLAQALDLHASIAAARAAAATTGRN
jgi:hypothetical protein